jgi:zinc/manganese transport system substrate-binding protein
MRAPAKLTLGLRVTGLLPGGYHALDALVVAVDAPADVVTVTDAPAGVSAHVHGPFAEGVPTDDANLAVRAALALLPADAGLHLDLEKHIPAGAGLGGGSSDAAAVRDAVLVVRNGLGLEPWMDRLLRAAPPRGQVVTASQGLTPLLVNNQPDPHAWMDPVNAQSYVRAIGTALAAALPAEGPALRAATDAYVARLAALHDRCAERFAAIPPARRIFVVGHPGFGYFAARFGLEMLAPPHGAGAGAVAALVRQVRARRLRALYFTGPEDAALMRRVAAEAGVPLLGRLFAETLSAPDGLAPTYEALIRHDTTLLVTGMSA